MQEQVLIKLIVPELGATLDVPLSRAELAGMKDGSTLAKVTTEKIQPKIFEYFARTPHTCVICQKNLAIGMNCNLAPNTTSPVGPVMYAVNPYPFCSSNHCNTEASRRAHQDRREMSRLAPEELGVVESELCDYCGKVQNVNENGRLKRCSRCKAKFYCSKECQTADWKGDHKLFCQKG